MKTHPLFESLANPTATVTLIEQAEALKERGMRLAAEKRTDAVNAGKLAMLRALVRSPDGTATIDDATDDLTAKFAGGGRWRGTVPRSLATAGIIKKVGVVQSGRPSRHRGYLARWRIADRNKASREIERLTALLSAKENPLSIAVDAGKVVTDSNSNSKEN